MTDLDERLTSAFADLFDRNRFRFRDGTVSGGPGYYGVRAATIDEDGSEVELTVTFRAGVRYCCFESVCHAAHYRENWWGRLRESMDRHGLGHLSLPIVRAFRGVIERGAKMEPGTNPPAVYVWEGAEYTAGPWQPIRCTPNSAAVTRER